MTSTPLPLEEAVHAPSSMSQLNDWKDPITFEVLQGWRRQFHQHPEIGWSEFRTTATVAQALTDLGFAVKVGAEFIQPDSVRGRQKAQVQHDYQEARDEGCSPYWLARMNGFTGCVATFDTGQPGPHIAFRFELDAIEMDEPTSEDHFPAREGFVSQRPGLMHACAHDGHLAVALGLAQFIKANVSRLRGKLTVLFQPSEEGSRGAHSLLKSGVLDNVDVLLVGHLSVDHPAGMVAAAPREFFCTTKMDFHFHGVQSHAGMQPELGRNALLAAADAALLVMSLPRNAHGATRVNVGRLVAGEGRNVVASHAKMEIEVRGSNQMVNDQLTKEAIRRAQGAAMSFGVGFEHTIEGEASDFTPDEFMTQLITVCAHRARLTKSVEAEVNLNYSDDATLLMKHVQIRGGRAGYFLVGAMPQGELTRLEDNAHCDFEEPYLLTLYDTYTNLLFALSDNWK